MTSGQLTRSRKEVQCQVQISIFFMQPSHPQFLTDFFQTLRLCLVHRASCTFRRFYITYMRSTGGHDLVMLKPKRKFSNSSDSENSRDTCFISSLVCLNAPICNNTLLCFLWDVLIQAWCQIRSTEDK